MADLIDSVNIKDIQSMLALATQSECESWFFVEHDRGIVYFYNAQQKMEAWVEQYDLKTQQITIKVCNIDSIH